MIKVKAIVEKVNWPCETRYLYHPVNRGCALASFRSYGLFMNNREFDFVGRIDL